MDGKEVVIMAKKMKEMGASTCTPCNPRCWAAKLLLVGVLVLGNEYYLGWSWAAFVGWLLVLMGLLKLVWPCCVCCKK